MFIAEEKFREIEKLIPIATVNAIIFNRNGEVLLLKRAEKPARGEYWIPGGRIQAGQSLEEALKERVVAETGLKWTDLKLVRLASVCSSVYEIRHNVEINFLLELNTGSDVKINGEHSDFKWVHPDDFEKENVNDYMKKAIEEPVGDFRFDF